MYLLLRRKPQTMIQFATGQPPDAFDLGEDRYRRQRRPLLTATWRVDDKGYPVAIFCRLVHGEQWPNAVMTLPRLDLEGTALTFWLTTERNFAPHDMLCDDVAFYQAEETNFAWAFSMTGVSPPAFIQPIVWPSPLI